MNRTRKNKTVIDAFQKAFIEAQKFKSRGEDVSLLRSLMSTPFRSKVNTFCEELILEAKETGRVGQQTFCISINLDEEFSSEKIKYYDKKDIDLLIQVFLQARIFDLANSPSLGSYESYAFSIINDVCELLANDTYEGVSFGSIHFSGSENTLNIVLCLKEYNFVV